MQTDIALTWCSTHADDAHGPETSMIMALQPSLLRECMKKMDRALSQESFSVAHQETHTVLNGSTRRKQLKRLTSSSLSWSSLSWSSSSRGLPVVAEPGLAPQVQQPQQPPLPPQPPEPMHLQPPQPEQPYVHDQHEYFRTKVDPMP